MYVELIKILRWSIWNTRLPKVDVTDYVPGTVMQTEKQRSRYVVISVQSGGCVHRSLRTEVIQS